MDVTGRQAAAGPLVLRVASSLVLIPVALGVVAAGGWVLAAWVAGALFALGAEWARLTGHAARSLSAVLLMTGGPLAALSFAGFGSPGLALSLAGAAVLVSALAGSRTGRGGLWMLAGGLYLIVPGLAFLWLRGTPDGFAAALWLLVIVWATDTGSYIAGRGLGGPQIAPRFSPNKTWTGFFGGIAAGVLAGCGLALYIFGPDAAPLYRGASMAVMAMVLACATQAGDIGESWLKRHFCVKDSGYLIPGHGGVLDRLDGFLVAAPVLAITIIIKTGI